ncbi:MAG TPA: glycosyltransferase family 4 protein [bacterium]|nr:glycosyltransferase family 4 protein [bacterium]HQI49078.1 glycosyltransferase family 4 protein [bacterium]HQJ63279.1 glycosyltransferase family 4 protein [bacterium]
MPRVLITTYYFPPAGGAGVQRTLKFVKYLREFGWEPVVLTARDADYPARDETLLQEIPEGIKIYRAPLFEPYRLYRWFTGKPAGTATDIATLTRDAQEDRKWSERLSEGIRAALFVPDARMTWFFPALHLGRKILNAEKIDLIFSSAPPYTTHLIGRRLKRASGLPWVADFRDSWIGWLSTPHWRPAPARALEFRMEKQVLTEADHILTVSAGVKEDLLSRHPDLRDTRWCYLPNGFDAADLAGIPPKPKAPGFTLIYTGSLYGNRNPRSLLRALEQLVEEQFAPLEALHIRLVGRVGEAILQEIAASPAGRFFDHIPYVSHAESLQYLLAADAALLIIDDSPANRGILTGKLFEYIGARLPILALAPEGEASTLIRRHGLGFCIPPGDSEGIAAVLRRLLRKEYPRHQEQGEDARRLFERREQTRQLAALFDEMIAEPDERE